MSTPLNAPPSGRRVDHHDAARPALPRADDRPGAVVRPRSRRHRRLPRRLELAPLALAVGAYSYCEVAGFRAKPLEPGGRPAEVENQSWLLFNKSTFVRFVLCESVFMVTIPIGFIADSFWPVLIGAVLALPLIGWECWPSPRNRQRFAAALESAGHPPTSWAARSTCPSSTAAPANEQTRSRSGQFGVGAPTPAKAIRRSTSVR